MTRINYDGKVFHAVRNAPNGDVDAATRFFYQQRGELAWADYSGPTIKRGQIIAVIKAGGTLDLRDQHINVAGEVMTGVCAATPELLANGRVRLREAWRWMSGDDSSGSSIVEEVPTADAVNEGIG